MRKSTKQSRRTAARKAGQIPHLATRSIRQRVGMSYRVARRAIDVLSYALWKKMAATA